MSHPPLYQTLLYPDKVSKSKYNDVCEWETPKDSWRRKGPFRGGQANTELVIKGDKMAARKRYHTKVAASCSDGKDVSLVEADILRQANEANIPNVIKLLGVEERSTKKNGQEISLYVYPWCETSLFTFITQFSTLEWFQNMDLQEKFGVLTGLMVELSYTLHLLHNQPKKIIHFDIKPNNIMLDDVTHRPYFVDFGIARVCHDGTTQYNVGFDSEFHSPEQVLQLDVRRSSDIFSLGCVFLCILNTMNEHRYGDFRQHRRTNVQSLEISKDASFASNLPQVHSWIENKWNYGKGNKLVDLCIKCIER
jgi:serine/threonine protein kinase